MNGRSKRLFVLEQDRNQRLGQRLEALCRVHNLIAEDWLDSMAEMQPMSTAELLDVAAKLMKDHVKALYGTEHAHLAEPLSRLADELDSLVLQLEPPTAAPVPVPPKPPAPPPVSDDDARLDALERSLLALKDRLSP